MSNPKPVEGALERLPAKWESQKIVGDIKFQSGYMHAKGECVRDLRAALSAAPAPTLRLDNSDFTEIMAGYDSGSVTRSTVMQRLNEWIRIHTVMANMAPAPARDGVREASGECALCVKCGGCTRGLAHIHCRQCACGKD